MKLVGKRRKLQRPILIMASLMLVFSNFFTIGLPMTVSADEAESIFYVDADDGDDDENYGSENSPYKTIAKAYEEVDNEGMIVLLSDMTLTSTLTLGDNKEVIIQSDSEKYSIIRGNEFTEIMINVTSGSDLTFKNLNIDGKDIEVEKNAVLSQGGSTVSFEDVVIKNHQTKNNYTLFVTANSSKMIIEENTLIQSNKISGFTADNPPAVLAAGTGGRLIIQDGEIKNNTITGDSNGVIVALGLNGNPSFKMTGGKITDNTLNGEEFSDNETVGNVAVNMRGTSDQARFEFGGTAYVYNNKNTANEQRNVFLKNESARDSAYLSLVSEMKDGAKVGVYAKTMPSSSEPIVDVAQGYGDYTAQEVDAGFFKSDKDSEAEIQFDNVNSKVILAPVDSEPTTPIEVAPGGVSERLTSWVDIGRSANEDLSKLTDLVDGSEWNRRNSSGILATLNFNDAISVNGSNHYFARDKFDINDEQREVFSVQANSEAGFPWELGGRTAEGPAVTKAVYTTNDIKINFGMKNNLVELDSTPNLKDGSLLNVWSANSAWELSINGETKKTETDIENHFNSVSGNDQYYIGAGHHSVFEGLISETIMFDRKLEKDERQKVSSYLGLKYGLTLTSDYIASDGKTKMWTADNNEGYGNRITGIGRDDGSVIQKQSKSQVGGANVTVALGKAVEESNSANENTFANDKSFFIFGDNGEEDELDRIYKVAKTDFMDTDVTIAVDEIDGEYPTKLIISNDSEFGTVKAEYDLTDGKVTLNSSQFADGDYFTFEKTDEPEVNPGGVNGASLWLQPSGNLVEHSDGKVSKWKDRTAKENHATQSSGDNQPTFSDKPATNVNFNPMMNFDGNDYFNLDVNKLPTGKNPRSIVAVAATNKTDGFRYIMSWGTAANNQMMGMLQSGTSGMLTGYGNETTNFQSSDGFWQVDVPNELFGTYDGIEGALYSRMKQIGKANRSWNTGTNNGARIGSLPQDVGQTWNGTMGDIIVFDKVLDETERQQLSSYLSIKYGYTLDNVNYLDSDKSVVWNATSNSNYKNNITGIARDDNGALLQKQSNSTNGGTQVAIGIGGLASTNSANVGTLANGQYLIWGDNGKDLEFTEEITGTTDKYHAERVWNAQNTGEVGEVQLAIPADAVNQYTTLLVSESDTFNIKSEKELTKMTLNGVEYYATKVTLKDGNYFTFAAPSPYVDYDKVVEVKEIDPDSVTYDSDKGRFTVPLNINEFTFKDGDKTMVVTRDADGKLTISEIDTSIIAILTEPIGATVDTSKPTFKGTATPGSIVTVKISDDITLTTTADKNGNWAVTPDSDLPDGEYNIEVTAEKDDVTSSTDKRKLTVTTIDKSQLEARVEMAEDLDEDHYTPDSWNTYQDALEEAETVLDNPNATQTEINDAYSTLKEAQDALELKDEDAGVDKSKLEAKTTENINEDAFTSKSWSQYKKALNAAQAVLDDEDATQAEVDQALEDLTIAQNALVKKGGLGSLTPSTGSLNPGFATDVYEYSMNVGNGTSQLTLTPEAINDDATITITANGVEVTDGNIPLNVGANTIVVKVEDESGIKTYTITINRAGASSGGGGGSTGGGGTTPTPSETTENIDVNLEIDGDNPIERTSVTIKRTKKADGSVHDEVQLTKDKADEAIEKAKEINNNIARIIIPDVNDEVDMTTVSIPKESVQALRENGLSLEIATNGAIISLDNKHMDGIDEDFYFYVVPVKKLSERQAIEERARTEKVVREAMKSDDIKVVARPMTIETNLSSRPVTITLPLNGVTLPTDVAERDAYLQELGIFIEHTDGEKRVVFPKVVKLKDGKYGLQFTIEKFSTFTIIHLGEDVDGDGRQGKHEPYIQGFLNGEFGPELDVARLQMARMMAKLLGYSGEEYATYAPFKDIPKDHEGSGVIAFMKEQGIFTGDDNGNFRPWDPITRAHMAIIGANYKQLDIKENIAISFDDTKGHWARWIIEASRQAGIIQGYENGTFLPEENVSRQHSVLILNRMFDRGPLYGIESLNFSDIPRSYVYFNDIAEAAIAHEYIIDEDGNEQLVK